MQLKSIFFRSFLPCLIFLYACKPGYENKNDTNALTGETPVKYAQRFSIQNHKDFTLVYLFGHRASHDTTAAYVIYTNAAVLKSFPKNYILVKRPCQNIAALSSIYANMICDLGALDQLAAIDNIDYINNPRILKKFNDNQLTELSKGPEPDLEKIVALKPDIIFTFGMGDDNGVNPKLLITGIPVAVSLDHLEETPLARAEWIKFYGAFVNRAALADSIFTAVEKNYSALKSIAEQAKTKPGVFNEIKYGGTWYMPGGKSFMARLLKDAGANYLWKDDNNFGSLSLSFEQVYSRAKDAGYWINLSVVKTKAELLSFESRYAAFDAFKKGKLYNNNKVANSKGYSTYWETGMIYPDRILSDLIQIFHPELKAQVKNDLYYYQQIK